MFKTVIACAATLALASAQNLQDLANQANAALAPVLNQENPVTVSDHALSLVVNNYEWSLTEYGNEYELGVDELNSNANNLAPALSALLANVGSVTANNNAAAESLLDAEAASAGIDVENAGQLGQLANQASAQASNNANAITEAANSQYQQAAAALAENTNGITTQANQQINEALNNNQDLSSAVESAVNAAVANAGSVESLASDANLNTNALQSAAAANGNLNTEQAASSLNSLANQALNAGTSAANNNLPSGLANAANGAANNAANSASTAANSAANALNADSVNNVSEAASLVNGQ